MKAIIQSDTQASRDIDAVALADPAERINEQHRLANSHRDQAIEHAVEAGRLLLMVKQRFARGEFMPWIELNCDFAYSTAARYMTAAGRSSTGVEISSLSALFPSGRKPKPNSSVMSSQVPESKEETSEPARITTPTDSLRIEPDTIVVSDDDGPPPDMTEEDGIAAPDETELLQAFQREHDAAVDRVLGNAGAAELKRQAAEIANLKVARDGFMNGKAAITELLKAEQSKVKSLGRKLDAANAKLARKDHEIEKLRAENEALRERISVMEEST